MTDKKEPTINGNPVTTKQLADEANELTTLANQLELIYKMLGNVSYQHKTRDDFATAYFMESNLSCVVDNLEDVTEALRKCSDKICPD